MRSFLINSLSSVEVWGNYLNGLHTIIHLPSLPCIVEKFCKNAGSDNGWASQRRKICERATSFRIKEREWKNSMTTKNILFWLSLFHLKRILQKHLWIWMAFMNSYIIVRRHSKSFHDMFQIHSRIFHSILILLKRKPNTFEEVS